MSEKIDIYKQLKHIIKTLVENSIVVDQNFPKKNGNEIIYDNYQNLAFTLKDEDYSMLYKTCLGAKDYSLLMLDGAIIQMKYSFRRNTIISHVLSYYPNPNIENYMSDNAEYENNHFGNVLFADISSKEIVNFPLRFDFSHIFNDIHHPYSHVTLGNYSGCRIPTSRPISPFVFMNFILRNFYNSKFILCEEKLNFNCSLRIENTISTNERKILHFNIE